MGMHDRSRFLTLAAALGLVASFGCGGGGGGGTTTPTTPSPPPPPIAEESNPDATATYRVTFDASWSGATIPGTPSNPHFSPLIGGTHQEGTVFWEVGSTASNGIKAMAEEGKTSPLDSEINKAISQGRAERILRGGPIGRSPGTRRLFFDVSVEHPFVSLVSMVAPSPDWFVGVSGLSLLVDGDWANAIDVELFSYDAGTDDGLNFTSGNQPSSPRRPIEAVDGQPFRVNGSVRSLGMFRFRRVS